MEEQKIQHNPFVAIAVILGMGALVVSMALHLGDKSGVVVDVPIDTTTATTTPNPFESLTLDAEAVYVKDMVTGEVLYAHNSEAQLPLASLTKIMTALVSARLFPQDEAIVMDANALAEEGEQGFRLGQVWKLHDLLDLTMVSSSNDGAAAIAYAFDREKGVGGSFVEAMNQTAAALGLTQTYFLSATGLDVHDDTYATAYGSAHDIATLFVYTLEKAPVLLAATGAHSITRRALDGTELSVESTNDAYDNIPWLVAGKTGFTDTAGGNLVVVFEAGLAHPVVAVVLGSTKEGRFEDMEKLAEASFEHLASSD